MAYTWRSAAVAIRLRDVRAELKQADIIGLSGTGLQHFPTWNTTASQSLGQHEQHIEDRWGFQDTQPSNRSAGMSVLVNKQKKVARQSRDEGPPHPSFLAERSGSHQEKKKEADGHDGDWRL